MSIYLDLTHAFNDGALRAVLSSGQAVVLHRLALMSKDGDWILRESGTALAHVLSVLAQRGARYRFGAPLDVRWMAGAWSAHFEFRERDLRVRTDFVTRPPRLEAEDLRSLWQEMEGATIPYLDARRLVEIKKTNREKDYAVIGELARRIEDPRERILASRSARDLLDLARHHTALTEELVPVRRALEAIPEGRDKLEAALDAERRGLIHSNERRLLAYRKAASAWYRHWPGLSKEVSKLPLADAHARIVAHAEGVLPFEVATEKQ